MIDGTLDMVLNKIHNTLRNRESQSIALHDVERHLREIENELSNVKTELLHGEGAFNVRELNRIEDVALEVENIIDSYSYFLVQSLFLSVGRQNEIANELKKRISSVHRIYLSKSRHHQNEQLMQQGCETQQENVLYKWLMESKPGRTVISVWGTRKETRYEFVESLCKNSEIRCKFNCYAQISVSKCNGEHQLLRIIAGKVIEGAERIEDNELLDTIKACLQNKRYLIILEGFKDRELWQTLDLAFPQNIYGNKVVILTHSKAIASLADNNYIIKMHGFTDLPRELQSCFQYCGLFPRNYSIGRKWIIGLWIAHEEFVSTELDSGKPLEEVAEDYLKELIEYSHLKVVKKDIHGKVKEFMVQDYAALAAAKLEELCTRHVLFIDKCNTPINDKSKVRSFVLFDERTPPGFVDALSNFEYLRILCLRFINLERIPDAIYELHLLKCLDLSFTQVKKIKSSVKQLPHLQTLDVRNTCVSRLPKELVKLTNLRHLYAAHPSLHRVTVEGDIGKLTSLQTFRKISSNHSLLKNLKELTKLRNLFIMEVKQHFAKELWDSLSRMPDLNKLGIAMHDNDVLDMEISTPMRSLEKIYLEGKLKETTIRAFGLFVFLKDVCIVRSGLQNDPLPYLNQMSSLVNLEIKGAYDGEDLMFRVGWFPNLKGLHLCELPHLSHVVIEDGTMEKLICLRLAILRNLEEVPQGLEHLQTLKDIILYKMPQNFVENVQSHVPALHFRLYP